MKWARLSRSIDGDSHFIVIVIVVDDALIMVQGKVALQMKIQDVVEGTLANETSELFAAGSLCDVVVIRLKHPSVGEQMGEGLAGTDFGSSTLISPPVKGYLWQTAQEPLPSSTP